MDRKRKISSHRDVHEHLICAICTDIFDDPRNLVCGHVFCKKCLENLDRHDISRSDGTVISCPSCRRNTKINSERRVDVLSRNIPISNLLDQDLSEEPGSSSKRMKESRFCSEHNQELRDIYCEACNVYICFKCFKAGHSDHATKTRNDFLKDLRHKIDDIKQSYEVKRGALQDRLHTADQEKQAYLNAQAKAKRQIEAKFKQELFIMYRQKESSIKRLDQHKQKWEEDYLKVRKEGERVQANLATAVPELMLDSESSLEDIDNEDLKSYKTKIDTVVNLLQTDIDVEPLKALTKECPPGPGNPILSTAESTSTKGKEHVRGKYRRFPLVPSPFSFSDSSILSDSDSD